MIVESSLIIGNKSILERLKYHLNHFTEVLTAVPSAHPYFS